MVWPSPVQAGIVVMLAVGIGYVWHREGRGRWYPILSERFLYGVPWGTLVAVCGVVGFYLFAQSGLTHWSSPVTLPFRTWSYFYPEGWLTAGFAHASPGHLVGNMLGTVVLAPIAEYFWGHYPPERTGTRRPTDVTVPPAEGVLARPWVRAFVVFPAAIILISILTSVFSPGWSLGFSGTVFAFGGFALVRYPVTTIISMVALTVVNVLYQALTEPVLTGGVEPGAPGPPSWVGVNVYAHLLGFLIGVVLAIWLVRRRSVRLSPERLFAGAVVFVLSRQLWAFVTGSGDVFRLHRGIGVVFALGVALVVTVAVVARDDRIPAPLAGRARVPSRRTLAYVYLGAVVLIGALGIAGATGLGERLSVLVVFAILSLPALPVVLPDRIVSTPLSRRTVFVAVLAVLVGLVAMLSVYSLSVVVGDDPVPGDGSLDIDGYTITYVENVSDGRTSGIGGVSYDGGNQSGVLVINEDRQIWTPAVQPRTLAHEGIVTVPVGGIGWREPVEANRTGWVVVGGEAVYAVELEHAGERVRSFTSRSSTMPGTVAGRTVSVEATDDGFQVVVSRDGTTLGTTPIPASGEQSSVGDVSVSTESHDGRLSVFVELDETRTLVAQREQY
ncbi:rhomboid family intramembrane serine protease [Halovenus marina]|uniref:rhomboid family intramembrane serine protease n=1 Tax=Halovenus marina TaxID=3396621 RepID=UPI003F570439